FLEGAPDFREPKGLLARKFVFDRVIIGGACHREGADKTGNDSGDEKLHHGRLRHHGVENHRDRRRNDDGEACRRRHGCGCDFLRIAAILHRGDQDRAQRRDIDEAFMIAPDRMNRGIASSGKLEAPSYITSARFGSICGPWMTTMAIMATKPSAIAIGTLSTASASIPTSINAIVIGVSPRRRLGRARRAISPRLPPCR